MNCGCGCGKEIVTKRPWRNHGFINGHYMRPTATERFWSHVTVQDGCWGWTGLVDNCGYGTMSIYKKGWKAHRYSWTIHNGEIPEDGHVLHKCDNPPCCNPEHLFLGNPKINAMDRAAKGRGNNGHLKTRGSHHWNAKLNETDVLAIRSKYDPKENGPTMLAKEYNVSRPLIYLIVQRRVWSHI